MNPALRRSGKLSLQMGTCHEESLPGRGMERVPATPLPAGLSGEIAKGACEIAPDLSNRCWELGIFRQRKNRATGGAARRANLVMAGGLSDQCFVAPQSRGMVKPNPELWN